MKIKNCHPKIEDGIDLRLFPLGVTGHYPLYLIDVPTNKILYWFENIAIVNKQIKSEEETIVFWIYNCLSSRSVSM